MEVAAVRLECRFELTIYIDQHKNLWKKGEVSYHPAQSYYRMNTCHVCAWPNLCQPRRFYCCEIQPIIFSSIIGFVPKTSGRSFKGDSPFGTQRCSTKKRPSLVRLTVSAQQWSRSRFLRPSRIPLRYTITGVHSL